MLLPMLTLPLLSACTVGLVGRRIGVTGANIIIVASLVLSTVASLLLAYEVLACGSTVTLDLGCWILSPATSLSWSFTIDALNAWLVSTVLLVSTLVHLFATDYMSGDPSPQRFMSLLCGFTAAMVILLCGDNIAVLFLGWEGIGVTSYLLISYWFDRALAANAAGQAIIVNRVGDTFLTLGLIALISSYGMQTADVVGLNAHSNLLAVLLVLAAAGKSAQFLLHTWLPNAMEGPTPVSSLLHAATLVLAGVYLLLRTTPVLHSSPVALTVAALLGTVTALFAASTALAQADIKRVIAYSTCSQFGYLIASTGLGQSASTILHLSSHAGFKALLFICAGAVIHALKDEQDGRRYGGLVALLPFTYSAMLVGSLSLMAVPYLSGNVSKDLLLELAGTTVSVPAQLLWLLGSLVAGITACYSTRLLVQGFFGMPGAPVHSYNTHEVTWPVAVPMVCLASAAVLFSYLARDALAGMGTDLSLVGPLVEAEFGLSVGAKLLPIAMTVLGVLAGLSTTPSGRLLHFLSTRWAVDALIARTISWPYIRLSQAAALSIDRGVLEWIGPSGFQAGTSLPLGTTIGRTNIPVYALYLAIVLLSTVLLYLQPSYSVVLLVLIVAAY